MNIITNELIPVYQNGEQKAVNTRELHEFLGVSSRYNDWIARRIQTLELVENEDFQALTQNLVSGGKATDYIVPLDTAREIAMMENSDKGREVRRYFIAVEKAFRQPAPKPLTQLEILAQTAQALVAHEKRFESLETEVTNIADAMTATSITAWQKDMNHRINCIVQENGLNHPVYRGALYARLEESAHCNIEARQRYLQARMKTQGCKYQAIKSVTKLRVIADDPKLRSIFEAMVQTEGTKFAVTQ